jgi:hypothetical protein
MSGEKFIYHRFNSLLVGLKNICGRVLPWAGLSLLAGYLMLNISIDREQEHSRKFKSRIETITHSDDSSHISSMTKRSASDSSAVRLDDIVGYDTEAIERMAANNEYLAEKSDEILVYTSRLDKFLIEWTNSMLDTVEHASRNKDAYLPESIHLDNHFSVGQQARIYFMLDALKDSAFCNSVGNIISMDVNDKYAEHGGIVDFNKKNKLQLRTVKSSLGRTIENDGMYDIDEGSIKTPFIAIYHLHAGVYTETDFAGPSSLDMIGPEIELKNIGQVHEFVITSLEKGKFNIDYYGGDSSYGGLMVVDLGNYSYNISDK